MRSLLASKLTYPRVGLALTLAALVTFLLTFTAAGTPQHLARANFDGWSYTAVSDPDGFPLAQINYDHTSVAALRHYAQVNSALAHQLLADGESQLSVTVTFRRPLSIDEFRSWAARVPLQVSGYQLRIFGQDGRTWTLGGGPSGRELVSEPDLQRNLARLASKGATDIRGMIAVDGQIASSAYDQLTGDPFVFLADVTRSAAAAHIAKTVSGIDNSRLVVTVPPAFADMERLGLENFQ